MKNKDIFVLTCFEEVITVEAFKALVEKYSNLTQLNVI